MRSCIATPVDAAGVVTVFAVVCCVSVGIDANGGRGLLTRAIHDSSVCKTVSFEAPMRSRARGGLPGLHPAAAAAAARTAGGALTTDQSHDLPN